MAGASGKKTKAANTAQLRVFQQGFALSVAIYILHLFIFSSGRTWTRLFLFATTESIAVVLWRQLVGIAANGDLAQAGLTAYMHDVVYVTWFVHIATALISTKFWYFYLSIPIYASYRLIAFVKPYVWPETTKPASSSITMSGKVASTPVAVPVESLSKRQEKMKKRAEKGDITLPYTLMAMQPSLTLLAVLFAASSVSAQQYDPYFGQGYNNASGFGTRIGVGVGVAALVLAIVLVGGFLMRKRRARAFKANYPVQHLEQGQGNYPMQPQQQPGYNPSFAPQQQFQQEAPPYANYSGAPAASFNNAHNRQPDYAPPAGAPPSPNPPGEYAPPSGPPPMQQSSSYAPPIGPPPVAYDPTNVHNK